MLSNHSMLVTPGAMGMTMSDLFSAGVPHFDNIDVELESLASQGMIGIDVNTVPAHLNYGHWSPSVFGVQLCGLPRAQFALVQQVFGGDSLHALWVA